LILSLKARKSGPSDFLISNKSDLRWRRSRMVLAATTQPIIVARNVDKFFGSFQALRDVTASFAEGVVTAIIAR
jgi:hypothetical protein